MTHHDDTDDHTETTSDGFEQRTDEASGIKTGPPGAGERDEQAIETGRDSLERAGGGH